MANKDPLRASICTHAALRRAARRLGQLYDDGMAGSGLKATQAGLLSRIQILNEPTLKELANELVMDLSALSHTLKPLVRDGFVKIVPDKRDARAKRVSLTAAGQAKLTMAFELWTQVHERLEGMLGPKEAQYLRAALDRISSPEFAEAFTKSSDATET